MTLLCALGPKGVEGFINFLWNSQLAEVIFLRIKVELYRKVQKDILDRTCI